MLICIQHTAKHTEKYTQMVLYWIVPQLKYIFFSRNFIETKPSLLCFWYIRDALSLCRQANRYTSARNKNSISFKLDSLQKENTLVHRQFHRICYYLLQSQVFGHGTMVHFKTSTNAMTRLRFRMLLMLSDSYSIRVNCHKSNFSAWSLPFYSLCVWVDKRATSIQYTYSKKQYK